VFLHWGHFLKHLKQQYMRGTIIWKDHQWKIQGEGHDLPVHTSDKTYGGKPLKQGMEVEFNIEPIVKRELREFAGSFKITTDNVARLIQPK
jgi:hypothetical protein